MAASGKGNNNVQSSPLIKASPYRTGQGKDALIADPAANPSHLELTAGIVSAYVANNSLPRNGLPALLRAVHDALNHTAAGQVEAPAEAPKPAVAVKKSVTPDYIACLENGKKFKSLKRHLRTQYSMTPEQYREKWGLPADYPMVALNYAKARSELARSMGLGQQRRKGKTAGEGSATAPKAAAKTAARPAKVTAPAPRWGRKAHS
jgi:predicted transcriptional regulator